MFLTGSDTSSNALFCSLQATTAHQVGHCQHGFQAPQGAVGAPVLGEFDGAAQQVALVLFELGLEALEEREGVRRAAGEARQNTILVELAHLAGGGLDDDIPESDLPVAAKGHVPAASDRKNGGAAILFHRIDVGMKNRITRPAGRQPDATKTRPLSRAVRCARPGAAP